MNAPRKAEVRRFERALATLGPNRQKQWVTVEVIKTILVRFPTYQVNVIRERVSTESAFPFAVSVRFMGPDGPGTAEVDSSLQVLSDLLREADAWIREDASREARIFDAAHPTEKMQSPVVRLEDGTFVKVPVGRVFKKPIPRDE